MKVTIIGSGNVAAAIAGNLSRKDNRIKRETELVQIISRNRERGEELARETGAQYTPDPSRAADADLYIIAVTDDAIGEVATQIPFPLNATVAHTAGGVGMDVLGAAIKNKAVLYPLQTFSPGRTVDLSEVPLLIEYSSAEAEKTVGRLAAGLSARVEFADTPKRIRIHTAAVFACNFTNFMYVAAEKILRKNGIYFDMLHPLISETTAKVLVAASPTSTQTGPAVRGDKQTMQRHLELLASDGLTDYEEIYRLISKDIWETLKKT